MGRAWGAGRRGVMGGGVRPGVGRGASLCDGSADFSVAWREAMPPAVVGVGCNQSAPYAMGSRIVRRKARPSAIVSKGALKMHPMLRARLARRKAKPRP